LFVLMFCSQPSSVPVIGRRQLANPATQLELQTPFVHSSVATFADAQGRPQAPQLVTVFWLVGSQPFWRLLSQS